MNEEKQLTYLEKQLEATILLDDGYKFIFQRTKIKLKDELELGFIHDVHTDFHTETIVTEDEVKIIIKTPPSYLPFSEIKNKSKMARWILAHQLIKKVKQHSFNRLNMIICPENIVFDESLTPYFLHYGIKESIPPYERDDERLLHELKATITSIVAGNYPFLDYFHFYKTLKLNSIEKEIMNAKSIEQLLTIVEKEQKALEKLEKTYVSLPEKKWRIHKFALIGLAIIFLPVFIYSLYSMFFHLPKYEAYVQSGEYFIRKNYSDVMTTLEKYDPEDMPYIVQYQLAYSYVVVNDSLQEFQKQNIQNMITLQTDPQYFLYWIFIGRGMNEDAIDIARSLDDQELVTYGLVKLSQEIMADDSLTGEEKQKKIEPLQKEIQDFVNKQKALEEEKENQQQTNTNQEDEQTEESTETSSPKNENNLPNEKDEQNNKENKPKDNGTSPVDNEESIPGR